MYTWGDGSQSCLRAVKNSWLTKSGLKKLFKWMRIISQKEDPRLSSSAEDKLIRVTRDPQLMTPQIRAHINASQSSSSRRFSASANQAFMAKLLQRSHFWRLLVEKPNCFGLVRQYNEFVQTLATLKNFLTSFKKVKVYYFIISIFSVVKPLNERMCPDIWLFLYVHATVSQWGKRCVALFLPPHISTEFVCLSIERWKNHD